MKCSNCETENQDGEFCGFCGADLSAQSKPVTASTAKAPVENAPSLTSIEDAAAIFAGAHAASTVSPNEQTVSDKPAAQQDKTSTPPDEGTREEPTNHSFAEVVEDIVETPVSETATQSVPFQPVVSPPRPPAGSQTSVTAIAALIAVFIVPILGLVLGYLAKKEITRSSGMKTGLGLAIASIVLGWVFIGFGVLVTVVGIAASLSQR